MRMRKTRTLRSFVLRALVPRAVVFGIGAAIIGLGQAMSVDSTATSVTAADQELREPAWTWADHADHPGCVPSAVWPTGTPADFVVVHSFRTDDHRKIAFDVAWRLNHNDTDVDDVWVIGVCGPGPEGTP